jgi:hypothetical protein
MALQSGTRLGPYTIVGAIELDDADTGAHHELIHVDGMMAGKSVGVSHDNRWVSYTETATEGDIWMATIQKPGEKKP